MSESFTFQGLSKADVPQLKKRWGPNTMQLEKRNGFIKLLRKVILEPMFLLLAVACFLYFLLAQYSEGVVMAISMVLVATISIYQDRKNEKAVDALREFVAPGVKVIRDANEQVIATIDLVPGDIIILEEGDKVPADAIVLQSNDLWINESLITGESLAVAKNASKEHCNVYQGSAVESGRCVCKVLATGNRTILGEIGKSIASYHYPPTPLQRSVRRLVKMLTVFGLLAFVVIFAVNYHRSADFANALLSALVLAMSAIPEEIPVAFASFMVLGSFRMSKLGIIARQPEVIENLGAVTMVCLDKTGTITENRMQVRMVFDAAAESAADVSITSTSGVMKVLEIAMLASETEPFDAMEKAICDAYKAQHPALNAPRAMVYEYPLEGNPPMMTHVYNSGKGDFVIAAKGAPERIMQACRLQGESKNKVVSELERIAAHGYRVLGVAYAEWNSNKLPEKQDDFDWIFVGLVGLYDPPKKNAAEVIRQLYDSGIKVKLLTGDFEITAQHIASMVGMQNGPACVTGEEVMKADGTLLQDIVYRNNVFARMFPAAKLKVVQLLKDNGEVVAMSGDGVNDASALQAADIGIAMGHKGTETARRAADLIITDDNLEKLITAIREGRRVFNNLIAGIQYIVSIHIPIILTVTIPVFFQWRYSNVFSPAHVIFLELVMGPTCSVFFENEPGTTQNTNGLHPHRGILFFSRREWTESILQGLIITIGLLWLYHYFSKNEDVHTTRTMVFTTLIMSNALLTMTVRSRTSSFIHSLKNRNRFFPLLMGLTLLFVLLLQFVSPVRNLFGLVQLSLSRLLLCAAVSTLTVMWYEMYKLLVRIARRHDLNWQSS